MLIGSVAALIGVGFGAFGAHGLRGRLTPDMLAVFETGVRYQMYHAFALLITALALARFDGWLLRTAGGCSRPASCSSPAASTRSPCQASRCSAPLRRSAAWRFSPAGPASSSRQSDPRRFHHETGTRRHDDTKTHEESGHRVTRHRGALGRFGGRREAAARPIEPRHEPGLRDASCLGSIDRGASACVQAVPPNRPSRPIRHRASLCLCASVTR